MGTEMAPKAIHDLRSGFHFQDFAIWKLVRADLRVVRFDPHSFASYFHFLLLVHDMVVEDSRQGKFVGPGPVCVQNDLAVPEHLFSNRLPITAPKRTRAWCTLLGLDGVEAEQS